MADKYLKLKYRKLFLMCHDVIVVILIFNI